MSLFRSVSLSIFVPRADYLHCDRWHQQFEGQIAAVLLRILRMLGLENYISSQKLLQRLNCLNLSNELSVPYIHRFLWIVQLEITNKTIVVILKPTQT